MGKKGGGKISKELLQRQIISRTGSFTLFCSPHHTNIFGKMLI